MEDLTAAGRAADKSIQQLKPPPRSAVSLAEALRPPGPVPGETPAPDLEGRPVIRPGEWNQVA